MPLETTILTDRQHALLHCAGTRFNGKTFPAAAELGIRGGAYGAVTLKLKNLGLLAGDGDDLVMTNTAYTFVGIDSPSEATGTLMEQQGAEETLVAATTETAEEEITKTTTAKKRKPRENTKQTLVVTMLKRPEGATIQQIMDATGWQQHTVRSFLARTVPKTLGIPLLSEKTTEGERVYKATKEAE